MADMPGIGYVEAYHRHGQHRFTIFSSAIPFTHFSQIKQHSAEAVCVSPLQQKIRTAKLTSAVTVDLKVRLANAVTFVNPVIVPAPTAFFGAFGFDPRPLLQMPSLHQLVLPSPPRVALCYSGLFGFGLLLVGFHLW